MAVSMKVMLLIKKLRSYINGWNAKTLSYAGRLELIKSILQGVEAFWLSIFPVPATIRDHIVRICLVFLWVTPYGPIAWSSIICPREEGGLGVRDLGAWNRALMAKLWWNLHMKKDSLWIKWIHHFYFKQTSVWEWSPPNLASPMIKFLMVVRDSLAVKMGSLEEVEKVLSKAMGGIRGCELGKRPKSSSGLIYELVRPRMDSRPCACVIWSPTSTPKHCFILWLAVLGRLRTADRIDFLEIDPTCVFCKSSPESHDHLFFDCSFTGELWAIMRNWAGITRDMSTLKMAIKWLKKEKCPEKWILKLRRLTIASTIYFLWNARNRARFEEEVPQLHIIARKTQIHVSIILASFPHVEDNLFGNGMS